MRSSLHSQLLIKINDKPEYLQLLAKFVANSYDSIEITVLGDHQVSSLKNLLKLLNFLHLDVDATKSAFGNWLDVAAFAMEVFQLFSGNKLVIF